MNFNYPLLLKNTLRRLSFQSSGVAGAKLDGNVRSLSVSNLYLQIIYCRRQVSYIERDPCEQLIPLSSGKRPS